MNIFGKEAELCELIALHSVTGFKDGFDLSNLLSFSYGRPAILGTSMNF